MDQNFKVNPYAFPGLKNITINQKGERQFIGGGLTKEEVYDIVTKECEVTMEDIVSDARKKEIVDARHIICVILNQNFGMTLKKVGKILGGRDHTTVIHSVSTFRDRFQTSEPYRERANRIFHKIGIPFN